MFYVVAQSKHKFAVNGYTTFSSTTSGQVLIHRKHCRANVIGVYDCRQRAAEVVEDLVRYFNAWKFNPAYSNRFELPKF